ncbi:RNA-directed DNA polymerase, eukaryota, reverse transcriptase zinc-binding domain protein [Tanacetum coccineum]|uniref:RNA-directed DNA polymerase, eukaryota, reverse transcriptase zinc-binding domain protein n=1 Tax=Tanacetum coccineum TaxID=301880 RepID=A0ABQ5BW38_9ASTR
MEGVVNGNYEVNETQVESKENDMESHGENESVNGGVDENLDVSNNVNEEGINDNGKVHAGSNTDSIGKDNMSHIEGNLKTKNRDQENNGSASDDFPPMDTVKPKSMSMNNNSSFHTNHINMHSYAKAVGSSNSDLDKNLFFVPTGINDNREEAVIFEEDLVSEGCKKWQMTVCRYFMGCSLSPAEIRYNIRRMWSEYGLMEIQVDNNEMCFFKFKNLKGMNYVINQSSWMVKGKPLIVQKWDPSVNIEKVNPCKIPIWSRLVNVPLEAWTPRGISTLANRLGRPIMMDFITANMCHKGTGRTGYARILVEIEANKGLPDKIEVVYKDVMNKKTMTKKRKINTEDNGIEKEKGANANKGKEVDMEGFVEVINRKKSGNGNIAHMRYKNKEVNVSQKFQYRPKEKQKNGTNQEDSLKINENQKIMEESMEKKSDSPPSLEKLWRVNPETVNNIHKSANKYAILADEMEREEYAAESKKWSYDMLQYFKIRWHLVNRVDIENEEYEDIIDDQMNDNEGIIADEIVGSDA